MPKDAAEALTQRERLLDQAIINVAILRQAKRHHYLNRNWALSTIRGWEVECGKESKAAIWREMQLLDALASHPRRSFQESMQP